MDQISPWLLLLDTYIKKKEKVFGVEKNKRTKEENERERVVG